MTPERWAIVKSIFTAARKAPSRDRGAILESLCDGDADIREQVEALLDNDNEMPELETPARSLGLPQTDSERGTDIANGVLPERVGGYMVLRLVGAGRFGAVYEAMQPKTNRLVALKVLKLGRTGARALQRFEFEATALARLSHPGIAQIYEAGIDTSGGEARPFLAMEMVKGVEITTFATREQLDPHERVRLLVAVCDAAQHAHKRGIVHLDLKPANIVVSHEGHPMIVDFGVAMVSDARDDGDGKPAERGGTIPYMSPEQLSGRIEDIDLRSDVYALGALLYELLEGRLPREILGQSYVAAILRAKGGGGSAWKNGTGALRKGDLREIMLHATAAAREARYPSALELGMDLHRYLEDRPVTVRPATAGYVLGKFVKRRKGASAAIAAGAIGLVGMAAWSAWSGREARADAVTARELVALVLNEEVARVADTQGTQEARRSWLGHVRPGVMAMLERHPEDPGIALTAARLLVLESDVEHESAQMDAALKHRREAMALRNGPTLRNLTDERGLMDRSINLVKVGDILLDRGSGTEGRQCYEQALHIDEELAARPKASLEALDNLSWSYERMRRFATSAEEHRELAQKRLAIATELIRLDPKRALSWYNQAAARIKLADLCGSAIEQEILLRKGLADAHHAITINADSRLGFCVLLEGLRRVAEISASDKRDDQTSNLVVEMVALAETLRSSERHDMGLSGAALLAKLSAAEILLRWGEREEAMDLSHAVEAAMPEYGVALAGRPDYDGVRVRLMNLMDRLSR